MAALATPTFNITTVAYNGFSLANIQSENASSFLVRWSLSGQNNWTEVSVEGSTYTATGLTAATAYDVQVKAVGDGVDYEDSGWSESETVSTLTRLTTPTITAVLIDRTKIQVNGLSVPNANGYQVRIGTLSGGLPTFTVTPENGSVVFDRRLPRSVYFIQARALGDDEVWDTSDWCAEISIQTGQIIDDEMGVPSFTLQTDSFTTIKGTGLEALGEYRYQIATTYEGVATAPIKIYGSKAGNPYIGNLEPGTTYYVRMCKVDIDRCSLWSDIVSASTMAVTNTIEVTSGADSGAGTLRQAFIDATAGTKIVLKVASITLNSVLSYSKKVFVVGGLTARTVLQPGNSNQIISCSNTDWRHLEFTGNFGSVTAGVMYGRFSDCYFHNMITTGGDNVDSGYFWDCLIENCSSSTKTCGGTAVFADSVARGCINTGSTGYGVVNGGSICNSLLQNCVGTYRGSASSQSFLCACTLDGYSGSTGTWTSDVVSCSFINGRAAGATSGSAYNCVFANNQCTGGTAGVYNVSSVRNCYFENCRALSTDGGASSGSQLVDCIITNCYASGRGGGATNGTATRCVITNNKAGNGGGGLNTATATDCIISDNVALGNNGGGVYGSYTLLTRCIITNNRTAASSTGGGTWNCSLTSCLCVNNRVSTGAISDWFENTNGGLSVRNSTIGAMQGYHYSLHTMVNNLYRSGTNPSTAGTNSNNVCFSGSESSYFIDAANGDYRLKPGSLAIEQGSNDYVTTETDLAGNPRISGTNVDLGCYEFVPVQLPTPTLNLETGYNTATIYFTLPDYCSSYEIEYAHNADFTNSGTATASTTGFVLPGLSGDTYLRARYKGVSGHTLDSEWSEVVYHYFDTTAPTVVQSTETLIMTVNTTVDFTSGMTVSDDHDPNVIPYYEVLDSNDDPIEVNGETHNIPSSSLAVGIYTLRFTATDAANNTGISNRPLEVRPPVLPTPTISFYTSSTDSITVAGLTEQFAEGWTVNVNGTSSTAEPDANGRLVIDGLRVTNVYEIKVMALGNGITTGDSAWSNVVTASPSPAIIAYSDIHIANQPTGQYSAVRKADLNERVPTGGQKGEVIVWGDDGPEWTPGIIPIVRVIR